MKISDQIRQRIESAISSGELLPGDAIDDAALSFKPKAFSRARLAAGALLQK
jgi:hypothetical protein